MVQNNQARIEANKEREERSKQDQLLADRREQVAAADRQAALDAVEQSYSEAVADEPESLEDGPAS